MQMWALKRRQVHAIARNAQRDVQPKRSLTHATLYLPLNNKTEDYSWNRKGGSFLMLCETPQGRTRRLAGWRVNYSSDASAGVNG